MGTEITTAGGGSDWNGKLAYCERLADSGLLPQVYRRQPANLLWALEYAAALGLSPMAAITGVHVIEGKPSASAALISALVRRAGHRLRVTSNDKEATATIIRKDDPDFAFTATWTMQRATAAGLTGKQVWRQYPAAMLAARAITECARNACEEALIGVHYTPEELGADVDEDGVPVSQQTVTVRAEPTAHAEPAEPQKWNGKERAYFCATLHEWGLQYEDVAAWCESVKRPRPSVMTSAQRETVLDYLRTKDGADKYTAWLSKHSGGMAGATPQEPPIAPQPEQTVNAPAAEENEAQASTCAVCGVVSAEGPVDGDGRCVSCAMGGAA